MNEFKPTVFLSYCVMDEPIADIIEESLLNETNNKISISRYTNLKYKDSFKDFMNSIQEHDFVICIISDSYLRSHACMYEVGEVIKDNRFSQRLMFFVLRECDRQFYIKDKNKLIVADIYGSIEKQHNYIKYWENEYKKTLDLAASLDLAAASDIIVNLKEVEKIYKYDIGEFITYLRDAVGKSFTDFYNESFSTIIRHILPDYNTYGFSESKTYSDLFFDSLHTVCNITKTDYNQIALFSKTGSHTSGLVVYADNISSNKQSYRIVILNGAMGEAFTKGKVIYIPSSNENPYYFNAVNETKSEIVIPIKKDGSVVGVINSESETESYYTKEMTEKLCNAADSIAICLNKLGYETNICLEDLPYIKI